MKPRWRVLAIYAAASAAMQFEWLRFAPVTDAVAAQYGVSIGAVGWLSLVFPLLFLPLALPSGALVDRLSVRSSLRIAVIGMLLGAVVRLLIPGFAGLLASQIVIALVQPLLMSLVSRLVLAWFPTEQQLDATGFATMALFAGLGFAFVLVPMMSPEHINGGLWIDVLALCALSASVLLTLPADPKIASTANVNTDASSWLVRVGVLLKTAPFAGILLLIFLANGYFNAIFTWLQPLLEPQGIDASRAGLIGLLVLIGGIASMAAIGKLDSGSKSVRRVVVIAALVGLPLTALLLAGIPFLALCVVAVILGALMLGPLPLLIELVATTAGPQLAGTAVSAFWLAGNAGAAAVIASLSPIADSGNWTLGGALLGGLLLVESLVAAMLLRSDSGVIKSV
jgi:predicted MFS family arabinose efflux permease